ncbi:g4893 [Coccomyxa viridis]|uniref:G4893 protein n=1 Tax=Coccomyxa viridis TaxID=1274662 RepID=A0ABP1FRF3_9CHLO
MGPVMLSCPVSQAVWHWFAATWTAVTQQPAPPLHADLLLADDRRGPWQPAAGLDSLWQRLRLPVITQLWDAYCRARSRPEQPTQPAHIAARVISAARIQMRRDWLLVGSDIRLRAGVLSHWLRGRQPTMTAEAFQSRWCHEEVLCSRPAEVTEPPHMHWTAAHPVPLPR